MKAPFKQLHKKLAQKLPAHKCSCIDIISNLSYHEDDYLTLINKVQVRTNVGTNIDLNTL